MPLTLRGPRRLVLLGGRRALLWTCEDWPDGSTGLRGFQPEFLDVRPTGVIRASFIITAFILNRNSLRACSSVGLASRCPP